jgi:mannose-1-phosphate guanylyltransferase
MKALILAGGEGTRLRPLTYRTPKSLLPICNRPFLEHQLMLMADHGITEAMLLTGYLAEAFPPFVERMARRGITLEVVREEQPLGTAGPVRAVLDRLDGTTIVFNGDVLTDLDLTALIASHRERGAAVTLTLKRVEDAGQYGLVTLAADGRVLAFVEKPPPEVASKGGAINAGTYVLEPSVMQDVPTGEMWSFERQVFPSLVQRREPVYGFVSEAYWLDIGTQERYLQAHFDVIDGLTRAEPAGDIEGRVLAGEGSVYAGPGPASLGARCSVATSATLERVVLLDDAVVEDGAAVRDSVLGPGATVSAGATCEGRILAAGERFQD